ncbi:AraC family transcriptional regulator [Fluviicola taffensis]|uniref:AraC family transcriptional regulator n=1 Tax=Fluviicola taffensis TaxID=191579 RepID=UPI0031377068
MKLDFYKPLDPVLQEYIQGYYFISESQDSELLHYWTFPNNYTILSIHQNAKTEFQANKIVVSKTDDKKITADLVIRYTKSIEVVYQAATNEITVYFKPLGIQKFMHPDIGFIQENRNGNFTPFSDFEEVMHHLFSIPDRQKQIELFENYWISKFREKDVSFIQNILDDVEAGLKIEEIAEKYSFSRQHISKLFKENMGKTLSEYKKIHQFRSTLKKNMKVKNLTELAYENSYYDQSHFIKNFKELTQIKPTAFFTKVDIEKENIWLYI